MRLGGADLATNRQQLMLWILGRWNGFHSDGRDGGTGCCHTRGHGSFRHDREDRLGLATLLRLRDRMSDLRPDRDWELRSTGAGPRDTTRRS
jgi:hypothetical protein